MLRIGILCCDRVPDELRQRFGDYPDMFRRLLHATGLDPEFRAFDLVNQEWPPGTDACDAWLITGSRWSVTDQAAWINGAHEWIRRLHREHRPLVGICFGHQLIANALGGRAGRAAQGWGVGVHRVTIRAQTSWMMPAATRLCLPVSHRDQVHALPPGAQVLAASAFCPIAAFALEDHILGLQGHPEFEPAFVRQVMDRRREQLGETVYRTGLDSLDTPVDTTLAAGWIRRFLERAVERA